MERPFSVGKLKSGCQVCHHVSVGIVQGCNWGLLSFMRFKGLVPLISNQWVKSIILKGLCICETIGGGS